MYGDSSVPIEAIVRDATGDDMRELLAIDEAHPSACYGGRWTKKDFKESIETSPMRCLIASSGNVRMGFLCLEIIGQSIFIHRTAVDPLMRRIGVGSQLVHEVKKAMCSKGPYSIFTQVPETNLAAQKFFAACGFVATLPVICDSQGTKYYEFRFGFKQLFGGRLAQVSGH